ncbi:hypothetical protein [Staphylococcus ratti]|uniref:Uncharacterized protein n=1 Tax=Staphylococcus ratti TaxID=2892440 RepID=A0ABY3PAQ6_9STAP|nr:hypothetical protein [Staphylococcus ratti]UEX89365.1 hypothetical protein LN051_07195 [Staphylococcus ratti]
MNVQDNQQYSEQNNTTNQPQVNDNSYNNEEHQEYLKIKQNTEDLKTAERPPGAGGGGASWNYTLDGESFEEFKARTDREKAAAGITD